MQSEQNLVFEPAYHAFKGLGSEESRHSKPMSFTETNGNGCPQKRRLVALWNKKPRVSKLKDLSVCIKPSSMPEHLCKFVTRGLRMFSLLSMKERQIKKMCHPKYRLRSISNFT